MRETKLKKCPVRFTHASFHNLKQVLVAVSFKGDIFIIDFVENKFWLLANIGSCSVTGFCNDNDDKILVGQVSGDLYIFNTDIGYLGKLTAHTEAVTGMSFSDGSLCITSSPTIAIIWDVKSFSKVHVLNLVQNANLRCVITTYRLYYLSLMEVF